MTGLHMNYERRFYQSYTEEHDLNQDVKMNYLYGNLAIMTAFTLVFSACVILELGESDGFGEYRSLYKKEKYGRAPKSYVTFIMAFRYLIGIFFGSLS